MPFPFVAVAIGAIIGGAVIAACSGSSEHVSSSEDSSSVRRRKVKQVQAELVSELRAFEEAKRLWHQACVQLVNNSSLVAGSPLQGLALVSASDLGQESIDHVNELFDIYARNSSYSIQEMQSNAQAFGEAIQQYTAGIKLLAQNFEQIASIYRQDPQAHQELAGALRVLLSLDYVFTLPVPLFEPSSDPHEIIFGFNPKFQNLLFESLDGFSAMEQLIIIEPPQIDPSAYSSQTLVDMVVATGKYDEAWMHFAQAFINLASRQEELGQTMEALNQQSEQLAQAVECDLSPELLDKINICIELQAQALDQVLEECAQLNVLYVQLLRHMEELSQAEREQGRTNSPEALELIEGLKVMIQSNSEIIAMSDEVTQLRSELKDSMTEVV